MIIAHILQGRFAQSEQLQRSTQIFIVLENFDLQTALKTYQDAVASMFESGEN